MEVDRNSDKYLYPAEVKYIVMIYVNSINWFLQLRRAHSEVSAPFLILCTVFNLLCFVFLHLSLYGVSRKRR